MTKFDLLAYHATSSQFNQFRDDRFSFFFEKKADAVGLARQIKFNGKASSFVMTARLQLSKVIDEAEALEVWNSLAGTSESEFLYSMMCHETNEFPPSEVTRFLLTLRKNDITAVHYYDYSPLDAERSVRAFAVTQPSKISLVLTEQV